MCQMCKVRFVESNCLLATISEIQGLGSHTLGVKNSEEAAVQLQEHSWGGCGSCQV